MGIGSGRFAEKLAIDRGLDPSEKMAQLAEARGVKTLIGKAENMPFKEYSFDYAVMITVDCFLENIPTALKEVRRILKPNGKIIIGIINKNSELGQNYKKIKHSNPFYRHATFHTPEVISDQLKKAGFGKFEYWQTLITVSEEEPEEPQPGYGEGGFVVIKSVHKNKLRLRTSFYSLSWYTCRLRQNCCYKSLITPRVFIYEY
ncbi:MAG: class I SAM-dependent methyltransferase [Bacteroidota bacterium]